jgi:hypothetical protein
MTPDEIKAALRPLGWPDARWDGKLHLLDYGTPLDVFIKSAGGKGGDVTFMPKSSPITLTSKSGEIGSAKFHVFNFPDFFGPDSYTLTYGSPTTPSAKACGRAILKADGWTTTIAATGTTDDLCDMLDSQGGYVITHVGEIRRDDGSTYTSDQLDDLLRCLKYFLSFALGRWVGVALPVGFDKDGEKVFEQWGLALAAPGSWHGSFSWFCASNGEMLPKVFPGFAALWKNPTWKAPIQKAVYWYLDANQQSDAVGIGDNQVEPVPWSTT